MAAVDEVALTRRAQELLARLRLLTGAALMRVWDGLNDHHEESQPRWTALASPVVIAAQSRAIDTQLAYIRALIGEDIAFDRQQLLALSTVDLSEPFIGLAVALRAGSDLQAALSAGRDRAASLGDTAISHAARSASTAADGNKKVVGWRRVLTGPTCDWCQVVSTQRYRTAESAAFGHDSCDCQVVPIRAESDPGRVINRELLSELKASGAVDRASASRARGRAADRLNRSQ